VLPATSGSYLGLQVSNDGSTFHAGATDYYYVSNLGEQGQTSAVVANGQAAQIPLLTQGQSTAAGNNGYAIVEFAQPSISGSTKYFMIREVSASTVYYVGIGMGAVSVNTSSILGLRLLMNAGNIASGTFKLYGIQK
jgi:hypothetical protein